MTTERMEIRVDLLTLMAMINHNTDFIAEIRDTWEDYGARMIHTTLIAVDRKEGEHSIDFQMLSPIEAERARLGTMTLMEAIGIISKFNAPKYQRRIKK